MATNVYIHMLLVSQAMEVISKLYTSHQAGDKNSGFDMEGEGAAVKDVAAAGIWDLYLAKYWGIKLATNAAATVLRVDQVRMIRRPISPSSPLLTLSLTLPFSFLQIIMSKPAGGPKPKDNAGRDDD